MGLRQVQKTVIVSHIHKPENRAGLLSILDVAEDLLQDHDTVFLQVKITKRGGA